MPLSRPLIERFWEKVDRRGPDECWPWTSGCNKHGYGRIRVAVGKVALAHRLAYELQHNDPEEQCVLHECDNPPCCNPRHLFLGTRTDNHADMVSKGRQRGAEGEKSARAKFTEEQIAEIRRDYVRGSSTHGQKSLASKYNVCYTAIGKIVRGERWK